MFLPLILSLCSLLCLSSDLHGMKLFSGAYNGIAGLFKWTNRWYNPAYDQLGYISDADTNNLCGYLNGYIATNVNPPRMEPSIHQQFIRLFSRYKMYHSLMTDALSEGKNQQALEIHRATQPEIKSDILFEKMAVSIQVASLVNAYMTTAEQSARAETKGELAQRIEAEKRAFLQTYVMNMQRQQREMEQFIQSRFDHYKALVTPSSSVPVSLAALANQPLSPAATALTTAPSPEAVAFTADSLAAEAEKMRADIAQLQAELNAGRKEEREKNLQNAASNNRS